MAFYLTLFLVNVACFLPVYLFNVRERANPVEFLREGRSLRSLVVLPYIKYGYTDPFRVNLEFTVAVLVVDMLGLSGGAPVWALTALLSFGIVEVIYTAIMQFVFRRPPALASDLSLVRAGLSIQRRLRAAVGVLVAALILGIVTAAYAACDYLVAADSGLPYVSLTLAVLLLPPGLYHWRQARYSQFIFRTVYSPLLHFWLNLWLGGRYRAVLAKGRDHFERMNQFGRVVLRDPPSLVTLCVESYGSAVFRDTRLQGSLCDLLGKYEVSLASLGYKVASTYSEAPIFAGGSWLSYTTFTYGMRMDDIHLHQRLFAAEQPFGAYESLFHVLKRNGYSSYVLCPIGGLDLATVDWDSINRCFQSDVNIDFHGVDYRGDWVTYFGKRGLKAAPDQYSLNCAYEQIRNRRSGPFSLFFCTLNSHYPWFSPTTAVSDWKTLNGATEALGPVSNSADIRERYIGAIRYQLDYILRFVESHADDDLLFVIFGDHQPPLITTEAAGSQTPVHVIGRSEHLNRWLTEFGFTARLDLTDVEPRPIRHEGFLSLFMGALASAYGESQSVGIEYRPEGVLLLESGRL